MHACFSPPFPYVRYPKQTTAPFNSSTCIVHHTHPPSIFSLGYLALLATVPLAFVGARSFQRTSRHDFPKLFRAMSLYAGLVLCTLHIFASQRLGGPVIDEYVGVGLREHGAWPYFFFGGWGGLRSISVL